VRINRFEEIKAWQKSRILVKEIYTEFRDLKDYSFKNQIQRAVISVQNNIAEGFERRGNKELRQFLYISKGSSAEVRSMLYNALDLGYVKNDRFSNLYDKTEEVSKMLSGLIKKL